jgi:hypothetical protein
MTATNKRLLISESRGDSNRCTPWKRKPDQHVTRFPSSVRVWSMTIRISRDPHRREEGLPTQSTAPEKKGSRHNPQYTGRPIRRVVSNFFPTTVNGAVEKNQASVDNRLIVLLGSYHRHAIGTFNTCSRGQPNGP